jgi:hypothetical protein
MLKGVRHAGSIGSEKMTYLTSNLLYVVIQDSVAGVSVLLYMQTRFIVRMLQACCPRWKSPLDCFDPVITLHS